MSEEPRRFFSRRLQKHIEATEKRKAEEAARKAARLLKRQQAKESVVLPSLPPVVAQEESTAGAPLPVPTAWPSVPTAYQSEPDYLTPTPLSEVCTQTSDKPANESATDAPIETIAESASLAPAPGLGIPRIRTYPANSSIRSKAIKIVALRAAGLEDKEIAEILKIKHVQTIRNYVYIAGQHGWLNIADPKQQLEYQMMHKVVRNLDEALDDVERNRNTGVPVKTEVALRVAEGTLFKQFDQLQQGPVQQQTVVAIRIEYPPGAKQEVRENTINGVSAYVEGDLAETHSG